MEAETQPNRSYVEKEGEKEGSDQFRRELVFGDVLWVKLHGSSWWPAQVVDENTVNGSIKPSNRQVDEVLVRLYGSYKYFFVDPIRCCLEFKNILKENNDSYVEILKKALEQDLSRIKSGRSKGRGSNAKITRSLGKYSATHIRELERLRHICSLGTKIYAGKEHVFKKKLVDKGTYSRISPRISVAKTPPTKLKNGNLLSEKNDKAGSTKRKQEGKKNDPSSAKSSRISPRISVAKTPPTKLKNGNLLSEKNDKAGSTKRKQEGKKNDPSSAKSATTSEGKSRELSARKMRVMQNLGLIAPSGSPFHRNGYISAS